MQTIIDQNLFEKKLRELHRAVKNHLLFRNAVIKKVQQAMPYFSEVTDDGTPYLYMHEAQSKSKNTVRLIEFHIPLVANTDDATISINIGKTRIENGQLIKPKNHFKNYFFGHYSGLKRSENGWDYQFDRFAPNEIDDIITLLIDATNEGVMKKNAIRYRNYIRSLTPNHY